MSELLHIFVEAKEQGLLTNKVTISRRNGKIFDYILPGEPIMERDVVSVENLDDIIEEIKSYKTKVAAN